VDPFGISNFDLPLICAFLEKATNETFHPLRQDILD